MSNGVTLTREEERIAGRRLNSERRLLEDVETRTFRQIQDLDIEWDEERVIVTGRSRSYYIKQLATHAIRTGAPHARIDNRIVVVAG